MLLSWSDLAAQKKQLDHVPQSGIRPTISGGVHIGPGDGQADFPQGTTRRFVSTDADRIMGESHVGEVSVQSSVTVDTTQESKPQVAAQIQQLLERLSGATSQVDEYSRRAHDAISADTTKSLQSLIADTQLQHDRLLRDATARSLEIESEYGTKLKSFLQELDASKASNLASLEKDLRYRQDQLLSNARDDMDRLLHESGRHKIVVLQTAIEAAVRDVDRLTAEVRQLGESEVERRMNSLTTTVITTQTHTDSSARKETTGIDRDADVTLDKLERDHTAAASKRLDDTIIIGGGGGGTPQRAEPRAANITRI